MWHGSSNANNVIHDGFRAADAPDHDLKWRRQTWKSFVSFKEHCHDTRKISHKKHLLEIDEKEIYSPEAHLAFHVLEQSDLHASPSDSSDSDDEDCNVELHQDEAEAERNLDLVHSVYYVGGASRAEPSTWQFANILFSLHKITYGLRTPTIATKQKLFCHKSLHCVDLQDLALGKAASKNLYFGEGKMLLVD